MAIKRNNKKSICEKSTMIAVNIIKVSSFCLAKISLGALVPSAAAAGGAKHAGHEVMTPVNPTLVYSKVDGGGGAKRSKEPEARHHQTTTSYLMVPRCQGKGGHQEGPPKVSGRVDLGWGVDERAEDYITRFRERNRYDSIAAAEASQCIPPPPARRRALPPVVVK